jgi:hypothetical protein
VSIVTGAAHESGRGIAEAPADRGDRLVLGDIGHSIKPV